MKPTIEELKKIQKERNEKNLEEQTRISLAVRLNICPNCGADLNQSLFGSLFDYTKCKKCKTKFTKFDDNIYDLP